MKIRDIHQSEKKSLLFRERWIRFIHDLQVTICAALEKSDRSACFREDRWERPDNGGGGRTRLLTDGKVFEKAGVNTSVVSGPVTEGMRTQLNIEGSEWFACGLSVVIHPLNPFVPTVHANWRYFELYQESGEMIDRWFGGGTEEASRLTG